jgi:PilZ domain
MTPEPLASIPRDYPRIMSRIPVQIQVAHVWEGDTHASMAATLFNVSRGGAGVLLPYVLPPRTRLAVLIPDAVSSLRIPAEVVWTSHVPGQGGGTAVYGVRWMTYLSRESLEAMTPGGSLPA